jgi:hypothetical protein
MVWCGSLDFNGYIWFGVTVWNSWSITGLVRQCGPIGILMVWCGSVVL